MNPVLFDSELVTVLDVRCDIRRSGPGATHHVSDTFVALPLGGVWSMHERRAEHLLHATLAAVVPADTEYRMSHPNDDGDAGVALRFAPDAVAEALGDRTAQVRVTRSDVRMRHAVGVLLARISQGDDGCAVDDEAFALLRIVAGNLGSTFVGSAKARAKVDRVRIAMAERPEEHWTLASLAALVGCSPFHLAHQFRAHTGTTVHQYLADLRTAAALARIEAGEASLATVAADLGFAHHSHMTATLRRRLGLTPRAIRLQRGS